MITDNNQGLLCAVSMPPRLLEAYDRFLNVVDSIGQFNLRPINGDVFNYLLSMVELNILIWNVHGAGNHDFLSALRELLRIHDPRVLALVKPRLSGERADEVC